MSEQFILLIIYKLVPVLVGLVIIYWGYNLFIKGFTLAGASQINAIYRDLKIVIQNAAPGTVLFIVGSVIVVSSILRGGEISNKQNRKPILESSAQKIAEDTTELASKEKPNIDSIVSLGKSKLNEKQYIEAYKFLFLAKGLLYNSKNSENLKLEVNRNIQLVNKAYKEFLDVNRESFTEEESKSIKINDESLDTAK